MVSRSFRAHYLWRSLFYVWVSRCRCWRLPILMIRLQGFAVSRYLVTAGSLALWVPACCFLLVFRCANAVVESRCSVMLPRDLEVCLFVSLCLGLGGPRSLMSRRSAGPFKTVGHIGMPVYDMCVYNSLHLPPFLVSQSSDFTTPSRWVHLVVIRGSHTCISAKLSLPVTFYCTLYGLCAKLRRLTLQTSAQRTRPQELGRCPSVFVYSVLHGIGEELSLERYPERMMLKSYGYLLGLLTVVVRLDLSLLGKELSQADLRVKPGRF